MAFTWTKMLSTGLNGYYEKADNIISGAHQLRGQLNKLKHHIDLITPTTLSIFAFRLTNGDTYDLGDYLRSQGWNVKNTINPVALSFAVTDGKDSQNNTSKIVGLPFIWQFKYHRFFMYDQF